MVSVASPEPVILTTGRSPAISFARSTVVRTSAAAPSVIGEQSRRCSGSATMVECEHVLDVDLEVVLGVRVEQPVGVVLDRHRGELLDGGAVALHVDPRHHRVETREGDAVEALPLLVGGGAEGVGGVGAVDVGHLLDAGDEDDVRETRGDLGKAGAQGEPAGGAGRLDPRWRARPPSRARRRAARRGAPGPTKRPGDMQPTVMRSTESDSGVVERGEGRLGPDRAQGLAPTARRSRSFRLRRRLRLASPPPHSAMRILPRSLA